MLGDLFSESELPIISSYSRISCVADSSFKLISNLGRLNQYYDEPKFWQYFAHLNSKFLPHDGYDFDSVASGVSFTSEKTAITKCLCETIERYCNHAFFKSSTSNVSGYRNLKAYSLNPKDVVAFSSTQLKKSNFKKYLIKDNSKFSWTKGFSISKDKEILIPSQLVYLSYPFIKNEPSIYHGISTGAAGGGCLSAAIVRGICEIIERDAFMVFYLNKLEPARINLDKIKNRRVQDLLKTIRRYKLELYTYDITTNINVPTYLSVAVDRTGFGKAISLGLKTDLDDIESVVGSIEELFNSRTWIRTEFEKNDKKISVSDLLKNSSILTRGLLWYPVENISNLDFLLKSTTLKKFVQKTKVKMPSGKQLKYILDILNKLGYEVMFKDLTLPIFKELNYRVVKVLIPQMQPFYLDENRKLLGGTRLYQVPKLLGYKNKNENELNAYPHPFL